MELESATHTSKRVCLHQDWQQFHFNCLKCLKVFGHAGPSTVDPAKVNRKTVDAHKALQAALLPLGKARQQGSSPAELRDMAAAKGLLVQDVLRVCIPACLMFPGSLLLT